VQRIGVPGLSTTYLTGTLTTTAIALASGRADGQTARAMLQLGALVLGGAIGCLLALHLPGLLPAPPLLGFGLVALLAVLGPRLLHGVEA
jgi:hypothetical protein